MLQNISLSWDKFLTGVNRRHNFARHSTKHWWPDQLLFWWLGQALEQTNMPTVNLRTGQCAGVTFSLGFPRMKTIQIIWCDHPQSGIPWTPVTIPKYFGDTIRDVLSYYSIYAWRLRYYYCLQIVKRYIRVDALELFWVICRHMCALNMRNTTCRFTAAESHTHCLFRQKLLHCWPPGLLSDETGICFAISEWWIKKTFSWSWRKHEF